VSVAAPDRSARSELLDRASGTDAAPDVRAGARAGDLRHRLDSLPDGHPSSPRYTSDRGALSADAGAVEADATRPLSDSEHAEHVADVRAALDDARVAGLSTDRQYTIDSAREVWSYERVKIHDAIVTDLCTKASKVPCEGKAILAGGLPGAGKTTVLGAHAGIDLSRYMMINPDVIKEELAERGLVPHVEGLSPMEASDLVHAESSHIAKQLAVRACADRKNVVWDVTMSSKASTERRIDDLRAAGYSRIDGIFVDIPADVSMRRAETRYREGQDAYRAGFGLGGRYVPPEIIKAQGDAEWSSKNRACFEQVKQRFDEWSRYDNSVDSRAPVLTESSASPPHDHWRVAE
jgi:predicted kinase